MPAAPPIEETGNNIRRLSDSKHQHQTPNTKHHHTSTTPVYWRQEAFSLFLGNFTVHTKALYMAETKKRNVCIKVSYWVQQGDNQKTCSTSFDSSNVEAQRMGLPVESTPVKPEAGDDKYSGMHDQGPLPELHEGLQTAVLLGCVKQGKDFNDEFLSKAIQEEKTTKEKQEESHPIKRAKTES